MNALLISLTIIIITFMVHIILKNTLSLFTALVLVQSLAFEAGSSTVLINGDRLLANHIRQKLCKPLKN